ncbi:hypothetical protein [Alkalicoccobacillus gibsonii]|uniref:Uncharacterized protein n=1 Tax=Alkalicoccobacillus gibsonii TaxID=79881 RepID=A0ABU9VMC9_9BACI|nr:hypothetical protein [Alkalicoccobacillus gibsonii]MBM0065793.1 hypothetical protein [Alkalicoccobacillus gibsonii]
MIELLLEMMMIGAILLIGLYMLAAFARINLAFSHHKIRSNQLKERLVTIYSSRIDPPVCPMSVTYRPKIPSIYDQYASDDEAPSFVVAA